MTRKTIPVKLITLKILLIGLLLNIGLANAQQKYYFPARGANWKTQSPQTYKIDKQKLQVAVDFAKSNEYSGEKDLRLAIVKGFTREPFHKILGPTKKRGGPAGMILKNGYVIAQWGDTKGGDKNNFPKLALKLVYL